MDEQWRPAVGWESYYRVSDLGRVWSNARWVPGRWGPESLWKPGAVLMAAPNSAGRLQVTLSAEGRRKDVQVSVLVAEAFIGPRPTAKAHCCHEDGDLSNNAASNLRWDSAGGNLLDEVRHGTHRNSRKAHCPLEHPLAAGNLYSATTRKGSKTSRCKSCSQAKALLRSRGRTSFPAGDTELKALADAKCDGNMPGWRDWTPPEGFTRSLAAGGSSGGR